MNPVRPALSRGRLRWTLRMPRPVAVRDAGAACLARGRQWPQGGAGCTAAPARGREPPPAWNSRARRAGDMGDAPQSRAQRRGNAARHGRFSLRCAGCWTKRNSREANARQTPVTVLDDRGNELRVSVYREQRSRRRPCQNRYPRLELSANCLLLYSVRQKPNLHNGRRSAGPSQILPGFLTSCDLSKGRWFLFL